MFDLFKNLQIVELFVGCFFFFCGKLLELVKLEAHDSSFELLPVKTLYVITYVITFYD